MRKSGSEILNEFITEDNEFCYKIRALKKSENLDEVKNNLLNILKERQKSVEKFVDNILHMPEEDVLSCIKRAAYLDLCFGEHIKNNFNCNLYLQYPDIKPLWMFAIEKLYDANKEEFVD